MLTGSTPDAALFIERPIFAWVIALFIVLTGLLSIPRLPVAQYPEVAPPGIIISVSYPGASPEVMNTSVVSLIEREIASVDNLLYLNLPVTRQGWRQLR